MLDLMDKSNALKTQYNTLAVEHQAFVTKRDTTGKYIKQVRKYVEEQRMKTERQRSYERTHSQQKRKNYLK